MLWFLHFVKRFINDNKPIVTSSSAFTADENQTAIGVVTATDADGDEISFSMLGDELRIGEISGELTFATAPDYETKSSYSDTVVISDGEQTITQDITVNINDLDDEPPIFTSSNTFNIDENVLTFAKFLCSFGLFCNFSTLIFFI